jgi:hypothetical protein
MALLTNQPISSLAAELYTRIPNDLLEKIVTLSRPQYLELILEVNRLLDEDKEECPQCNRRMKLVDAQEYHHRTGRMCLLCLHQHV